jgi:hypothetical protein
LSDQAVGSMNHTGHGLSDHDLEISPKATNDNLKADVSTHETFEAQKNEKSEEKPYSIYTHSEKWFIVAITSLAGLFR